MSKAKKQKVDAPPPIPEPLSVDYAPTGRASCKKCQSAIGEGSVRVGRLVRSRFHDGFDTQLYHWRCGSDYGSSLDEFRGWQTNLRWGGPKDDVERLMETMGDQLVDDSSVIEEYKKRNQWVHAATDHLADAPAALLRQVFEANDMVFSDRSKAVQLAAVIADCLLFGKLPACPTCNTNGLRQEGTDIRCHGWFSASTKCEFKFRYVNLLKDRPDMFGGIPVGDELTKSRLARCAALMIPEDVAAHKAFKTLILPKELQGLRKKLAGASSTSARGGGVASSVIATLDSEDEDTLTSEPSQWLMGMRFVFCGLSHSEADELARKIMKFGGNVQEDVVVAGHDRTTHLVISEEEIFKDPKSAKYRKCNDAGIPIVKPDFILAATDVKTHAALPSTTSSTTVAPPSITVSGRSKKAPNAIINGTYVLIPNEASDRATYRKEADKKSPELFLYYSIGKQKWKIAPSLDDGKGHVAINKDAKAEKPENCQPGGWSVFSGKDKGFELDPDVLVSATSASSKRKHADSAGDADVRPSGVLLRQRKYLKSFVVEGSVGKKLPRINELVLAASAVGGKGKKRPPPTVGSPILTVDEEAASEFTNCTVFVDAHQNVYNVLLTKTDAATNTNKFYAIQLLTYRKGLKSVVQYAVFRKWGRFGATVSAGPMNGSMAVEYGGEKNEAIDAFKQKFSECTGLDFEVRDIAPQKPGRYAFVELAGQTGNPVEKVGKGEKAGKGGKSKGSPGPPSQLPKELQELIELIFDLSMIEREMNKSMDIDTSRLPPNALSRRQLAQGLAVLKEIERILSPALTEEGESVVGGGLDGPSKELRLRDCANRFYTIVPHCFEKKQVVPVIDGVKLLKKRIRNLEDLMQIVDLEEIRTVSVNSAETLHRPLTDVQFEQLDCKVDVVKRDSVEWNLIEKSVHETHAPSHDTYTMKIDKVFKVERGGEAERFAADPCQHNKRLLWHGSRLSNWASILKHGLRIAPKEAPVTGYMFGKGVYFADSSSKSANYCFANEEEPDGLLVLCDVSLGKQYTRLEAQYEASSKCRRKECDSTWGVGQSAPLESATFPDGSVIPCGPVVDNSVELEKAKLDQPRGKPSLLYNEFIVYRESQLLMKYIVHIKFDFQKKS